VLRSDASVGTAAPEVEIVTCVDDTGYLAGV
jgi:hypothetical protein